MRTPERYIAAVEAGRSPEAGDEELDADERRLEGLQLALRTARRRAGRRVRRRRPRRARGAGRASTTTGSCSPARAACWPTRSPSASADRLASVAHGALATQAFVMRAAGRGVGRRPAQRRSPGLPGLRASALQDAPERVGAHRTHRAPRADRGPTSTCSAAPWASCTASGSVRAFDRATELGLPVVCVTRSGGARMQEGMVSLIQMGRTAAAARRHADAGLLSVAVHRSPTTGGVLASYGSLVRPAGGRGRRRRSASPGPASWPRRTGEAVGDAVAHRRHRPRARPGRRRPRRRPSSTPGWPPPSGSRDEPARAAAAQPRPADGRDRELTGAGARCCGPAVPTARRASTWPPPCPRLDRPGRDRPDACAPAWPRSPAAGSSWSPPTATAATGGPARRLPPGPAGDRPRRPARPARS